MKMEMYGDPGFERRVQSVVDIIVLIGAVVVLSQCVDSTLFELTPSAVQGHVDSSPSPGRPAGSSDESPGVEIIFRGPIEEAKIREVGQLMGQSAVIRYQY